MYHGTKVSIDQHRPSKEWQSPVSAEWLGLMKTSEISETYGLLSILEYRGKKSYPSLPREKQMSILGYFTIWHQIYIFKIDKNLY